jgi:UV DNA damage repair endonuclease
VRLSFHPGQYVVLNSERPDVRAMAARELDVLASLLDAMELGPEAVVVLHVGGGAGSRDAARERFLRGLDAVGEPARRRLFIENDDRVFGLADLVDPIAFEELLRGPAHGRRMDVMLEAKGKDLALLHLRKQLLQRGMSWQRGAILV